MKCIHNKFGKYYSEKTFSILFTLWFLLFPFDSTILPVSVGFMTIYPELVLTFLLLAYSFTGKPIELPSKIENLIILFFFTWLAYGLCYFPFVTDKKNAFYEIRSLVLMAVYAWIIIRSSQLLGKTSFFSLLNKLSVFLFIFLVAFGFFEYFTGIHFAGEQTKALWHYPVGAYTYAPIFLLDNRNAFPCYLILFAVLIFISSAKTPESIWKILVIILILFFFSVIAESKFGEMASFILFAAWIFLFLHKEKVIGVKKYLWWIGVSFFATVFCLATKKIYMGPMWKDGEHYLIPSVNPVKIENDKLFFYSPDSLVKQFGEPKVIKSFREYQMSGTEWSTDIRKNLFRNGWHLFLQSNFMGVGPAQFRWYHEQHKVPYFTATVTNPHNYLMEIASQYGILILVPFLLLLLVSWTNAFKLRKNNRTYFSLLTACYLVFFIASNMPSSFLMLNISWIVIPVLLMASPQL